MEFRPPSSKHRRRTWVLHSGGSRLGRSRGLIGDANVGRRGERIEKEVPKGIHRFCGTAGRGRIPGVKPQARNGSEHRSAADHVHRHIARGAFAGDQRRGLVVADQDQERAPVDEMRGVGRRARPARSRAPGRTAARTRSGSRQTTSGGSPCSAQRENTRPSPIAAQSSSTGGIGVQGAWLLISETSANRGAARRAGALAPLEGAQACTGRAW